MADANKFKLGLFVCLSVVVACASILMLGVADTFRAKAHIMTLVSESVQGLTPGSSVKYRGVPIGKVSDITINTAGKLIRIDMTVNLSKFRTETSGGAENPPLSKTEFYDYLLKDIKKGLRCKIEPDGITGMKYMELDFVKDPPNAIKIEPGFRKSTVFHIPSVPSIITDLRTSVTGILSKLEAVDYEGISRRLVETLNEAQKFISNPDFATTVKNLEEVSEGLKITVDTFNANLNGEKLNALTTHMENVMKSLDTLSVFVQNEIQDAKLGKTATDTREALRTINNAGEQLSETMMKINEGMDALTELIQLLDADPSALLRGKSQTTKIKE